MSYLFSSESVSEGHPDKVADQISDAILDQFLAYDDKAHCAVESFVTTGQVVIMGEVRSAEYIDLATIARRTINKIGYTKSEYQFDGNSCGILTAIHEQSDDINRGVEREEDENQGAGDQGMMFGYACNETENFMPVSLDLAQLIMKTLADIRKEGKEMTYLRPDSKSQVTIEYSDNGVPQRIDTIVVSTQHDDFVKDANGNDDDEAMLAKIREDVINILIPRVKAQVGDKVLALFNDDIKYFVNPTGKEMTYLRPDSKSQVTIEYSDNGVPQRIDTIVVSTQHDDFVKDANGNDDDEAMLAKIREDVINILIPRVKAQVGDKVLALFNDDIKYFVNPTGKFVIGGPHGDTGLTGRKIIVDTYGGKGAHGGGAFSGKDSSKVDRSAAYAARYIAKNMVAAGVADEMLVQVAYAIGVAKPVSIYVDTYGKSHVNMTDGEIAAKIAQMFDLRPKAIERKLKLRQPMYLETAAYGHMGRKNEVVKKTFTSRYHEEKTIEVELFTWEKLDRVDDIKKAFGL